MIYLRLEVVTLDHLTKDVCPEGRGWFVCMALSTAPVSDKSQILAWMFRTCIVISTSEPRHWLKCLLATTRREAPAQLAGP